jgi:hypothetical protein
MPPTVDYRMIGRVLVIAVVECILIDDVPTTGKRGLENVSSAHIAGFLRRDRKRSDREG